jgi:hypothetical protein
MLQAHADVVVSGMVAVYGARDSRAASTGGSRR